MIATTQGKEKWRECPFGDLQIGEGFLFEGKKSTVASRLWTWREHHRFKRPERFLLEETENGVLVVRVPGSMTRSQTREVINRALAGISSCG